MVQTKKKRINWSSTLEVGRGLLPHPIKVCSVQKLLKKRRRASKDCGARIIIIIIIIIIISADFVTFFGYPN